MTEKEGNMRNLIKSSCLLAPFALALLARPAAAATLYDAEAPLAPFIYHYVYLKQGLNTIETKNLTAYGDTVLHVLYNNGSTQQQIAANDDSVGLASKVVFAAPYTAYYAVWVRSYSNGSGGKADLVVNGTTLLNQAQFGGQVRYTSWNAGDQFRVATTRFTGSSDSMVFLLRSNTALLQMNDDSGPQLSPLTQASTSESGLSRVVYGLYPSASGGYGRLLAQSPPVIFLNDFDNDGLTGPLESLIGTSSSNGDSDNDGIPDGVETIGGSDNWWWTFSRSSSAPFGNNPTRRNAYVEIDYMNDPNTAGRNMQPYAGLPADAAEIFSTDGNADLTLIVDDALPWRKNVGLDGCFAMVPDCVDFRAQKAASFSTFFPERRPFFHYAIFANQYDNGTSSGISEILGNDFVVTLGAFSNNQAEQRGTFMHEFGHNLNLGHFGNGNNNGANSSVHRSVMNYRYQFAGVPATGRHTYSSGGGGCAACATSPKQACVDLKNAGQCASAAGATCDCDLNEWGSAIDYDMTEGGNLNDGVAYVASSLEPTSLAEPLNLNDPRLATQVAPADARRAVSLDALSRTEPKREPAEQSPSVDEQLKWLIPEDARGARDALRRLAQAKFNESDMSYDLEARAALALKPNVDRMRASVARRVAELKKNGLIEGLDFTVAEDGTAIFVE